jgi:hypothetical protein
MAEIAAATALAFFDIRKVRWRDGRPNLVRVVCKVRAV